MAGKSQRSASPVRFVAVLVALASVAACQPVPRPFQPESKSLNAADLARLGTRGGIVVQGTDLGTPELSARFAGFLGAAMRDAGLLALPAAADAQGRYVLSGSFDGTGLGDPEVTLRGTWAVADPFGRTIIRLPVQQVVNGAGWRTGDPATMVLVAETIATALADQLNRTESTGTIPIPANTRFAIWTIDGLEQRDGRILSTALQAALRVRGVSVAAVNDPGAMIVTGWIERSPGRRGFEEIVIGWALLAPDGAEIGVVTQANTVPQDTFDQTIAANAPAIAGAAADGLVAALERHHGRQHQATETR